MSRRFVLNFVRAAAVTTLLWVPTASAQQTLTGYTGAVTMQGKLTGAASAIVRAYVNGLLVAEAPSDLSGAYSVKYSLDGSKDETAVVWFLPDDAEKVPEIVILKESSMARRNGIWSSCIPRVKPKDVLVHDVTFQTQKDRLKDLEGDDCFDEN